MTFLDQETLGPAIKDLLKGSEPSCAVAFWGEGACRTLFGTEPMPVDVRVICDVTMGGTNPGELKRMGAPRSKRLRHVPGLHAKVYLSSKGAIVCSANASGNGIGFGSLAQHVEAGVLLAVGSKACRKVERWFAKLWLRAEEVGQSELDAAATAWERRAHLSQDHFTPRSGDPHSLLDAVRADPERFRGVGFVLTDRRCSDFERRKGAEAVSREDARSHQPQPEVADEGELEGWPLGDIFSVDSASDLSGWPDRFICAHRGRKRVSYWFYECAHKASLPDGTGVLFAKRSKFMSELGIKTARPAMAEVDQPSLRKLFEAYEAGGRRLFVNGGELASALARS